MFDGNVNSDFSIGGTLNVASGVVFNEDSADVDFRVESNGNANMLFVDGGNDRVGVGTNAPVGTFVAQATVPKIQVNNGSKHMEFGVGGSGCGLVMTDGHFMTFNHQPFANRGTDTNLTERMRIDSSGRVLIGTTTEGQNQADNFTVSDSGNMGMTLRSTDSNECSIFFSDGTSGAAEYAGSVQYLHASNNMVFSTASSERMRIDANGAVTKPLQPAFLATVNGAQSDMAVGTDVTINFGTEIFDIGSNFASNTFTAPVTGKYQLNLSVRLAALDSASPYYIVSIETSNRLYRFIFDPDFGQDAVFWNVTQSVIADMDAGDTAFITFNAGGGAAQVDVSSDQAYTKFGGILIG